VGGFIIGFLSALWLGYEEKAKQTLTHHLLALATLVFVLTCFTIMVVLFFSTPVLPPV